MLIVPAEPDTNWNTLPASLNCTAKPFVEYKLLLSVNLIDPKVPDKFNVKEPKNKESL